MVDNLCESADDVNINKRCINIKHLNPVFMKELQNL